jgi:hypothetical protein
MKTKRSQRLLAQHTICALTSTLDCIENVLHRIQVGAESLCSRQPHISTVHVSSQIYHVLYYYIMQRAAFEQHE